MGEVAAERAAVADRRMREVRHRRRDQRQVPRDLGRAHQLDVARQRADAHRPVGDRDALQLGEAADVDEELRREKPQVQRRDEALPAGQDLRVVAMPAQERQRLGERARADVVESRRLHGPYLIASGLIGEPVPPVMTSGGPVKKNS